MKVFVAGSTGGIGLATAKTFLEAGATVFVHGRNAVKLENALNELNKKYSGKVFGFAADLSKTDDRKNLSDKIVSVFDRLDVLVSCVGNGNVKKGIDLSQTDWDEIMLQNFYGNAHLVNVLLPLLKKSKNGSICFVGSIAGLQFTKAPTSYSVAKSALHTYSKCLSMELSKDNIRVNIVHPGNIFFNGGRWEELQKQSPSGVEEYLSAEVSQKRFGKPEEIAEAILFLSADKSAFTTGSALVVDGGQVKNF